MKYMKKPVVIEAYRPYEGEIPDWFSRMVTDGKIRARLNGFDIETLEGVMHASPGDYIIMGVRGEVYPCKPDIFHETYEPVTDMTPMV